MNCEEIDRKAQRINRDNTIREKAIKARDALIKYFGEDLTGVIKGATTDVYAAFIAVLTDSGVSGFERRRNKSREILQQELSDAFKEAGFVNSDGELSIPGRDDYSELPSSSIGPLLPAMVAILEVEHGIDSKEVILSDDEEDTAQTPDEQTNQNWEAEIRNAPGFDPDAQAYVYVLKLKRHSDSSTWFYVGKRESGFHGLLSRIRNHTSKFNQSRVINRNGQELLLGDYNASMTLPGTTHRVVGVERIVPISSAELASLDNTSAESCYISEIERRTAYEVAIDHETTNVLGGK